MALMLVLVLALVTSASQAVSALPVPPADFDTCQRVDGRGGTVDCCIHRHPVKEFRFPDPSERLRIRKNAASLDAESIEKLNLANERVRALPETDTRSLMMTNRLHCGYCLNAYRQTNSSIELRVHGSWLFFFFHRWQTYFQERLLGSLIDDPTFGIPFYNWDNQSAVHIPVPNVIPDYFYSKPGLNARRDPLHAPPKFVDLRWNPDWKSIVPPKDDTELRLINNNVMHQTMVSGSNGDLVFLGGVYRAHVPFVNTPGTFEIGPHGAVHKWVGDANYFFEDLGPAYSSVLDPLYFSVHSNVDRLYESWLKLGKAPPTDPDFLDSSFYMFDDLGDMVRVTVRQSLEMSKLRYTYEQSDESWMKDPSIRMSTPSSAKPGARYWLANAAKAVSSAWGFPTNPLYEMLIDIPDIESTRKPRFSSVPFSSRVSRPHAALRAAGQLDHLEEVLVVEGIWVPSKEIVYFHVFINLPEADLKTPQYATEWCGTFNNVDQTGSRHRKSLFRISIGDKLKKLEIVDQSSVVVTLVPYGTFRHEREIQLKTIRVELQ